MTAGLKFIHNAIKRIRCMFWFFNLIFFLFEGLIWYTRSVSNNDHILKEYRFRDFWKRKLSSPKDVNLKQRKNVLMQLLKIG